MINKAKRDKALIAFALIVGGTACGSIILFLVELIDGYV